MERRTSRVLEPILEAYFRRAAALRLQPVFEISQANAMLNLGLPNDDQNRLTAADVIDPIVRANYAKPLGHRFVERIRRHFNGVLASPKIDARHGVSAKAHGPDPSNFAFYSLS